MENKSPIQLVIEFMSKRKKPVSFTDIVEFLKSKNIVEEDKFGEFIVTFYSDFSNDPSFAFLGNNMWSLSNRLKYDDIIHAEYDEDDDNIDMVDRDEEDENVIIQSSDDSEQQYNEGNDDIVKSDSDDDSDDNY